jgi:hypothetical protein
VFALLLRLKPILKLIRLAKLNPPVVSPDRLVAEVCRQLGRMKTLGFSSFLAGITDSDFKFALTWMFISKRSIADQSVRPPFPVQALSSAAPNVKSRLGYIRPSTGEGLLLLQLDVQVQNQPEETEEDGEDDYLPASSEQVIQHAIAKLCFLAALDGQVVAEQAQIWQSLIHSGVVRGIVEAGFRYGDASEKEVAAIRLNARMYVDCWERVFVST